MARGIHCCPNFLNLFCLAAVSVLCRTRVGLYIRTHADCIEIVYGLLLLVYELLLLPNNTVHCATSREAVGSIPDCVIGSFIHIILPAALGTWGRLSL